jgi:hypothetical protein
MTTEQQMPGLIPELYNPLIKWHAIQVTVYENETKKGKQVKASIKAKLTKNETWDNCALDQMVALQGRGRDARRAMHLLSETCLEYGHDDIRDHMLKMNNQLRSRIIEIAGAGNPKWKENYLRSGFGRAKSRYVPGVPNIRPLNPGVIAVYDAGSKTFGLSLGVINKVEQLSTKVTPAQKATGIVAYGLWLMEKPAYNVPQDEETPAQRMARFLANT